MSKQDQPNQADVSFVFADGVLTATYNIYCNATVATSLADEASATSTVTSPGTGVLKVVTVITPNTAVTSADNTVGGEIANVNLG